MMKYKAQPKPDIVHQKKKQLEWRLAIRNLIDLWSYHQRNLSHESSTAQNINPSVCSAERNEEERTKEEISENRARFKKNKLKKVKN